MTEPKRGVILSIEEDTSPTSFLRASHGDRRLFRVTVDYTHWSDGDAVGYRLTQWAVDELDAYKQVNKTLDRWYQIDITRPNEKL